MKKFIINSLAAFLVFTVIMIVIFHLTSYFVKQREFNNYNTESNTLFLKKNREYDILFMGISHARNFSRHKNHLRVENILNSNIVNIGQGGGICGVNEQLFYLNYFYKLGNKTSKIIYILSPPMLYSSTLPVASNTFDNEAFDFYFLSDYLKFNSKNKEERIISYLQSKLSFKWILKKPEYRADSKSFALDSLNLKNVISGQDLAYSGLKLDTIQFQQSVKHVEMTIKLAKEKGDQIILLIPPALFGKWRGHQETSNFAKKMENMYSNVSFFDGSETVLKPKYYYDSHHLNTEGVIYFTRKYLKVLLKKEN
ncbi:hypothetical protein ACSIGC_09410 [Tenacibaculum sp. ZS6-P6]|uniref:hypothetical protein n=1 Tax=Tenacibaculum sp. ZS6-P6 TaxID=3447503 RepID=UPI003F94927A